MMFVLCFFLILGVVGVACLFLVSVLFGVVSFAGELYCGVFVAAEGGGVVGVGGADPVCGYSFSLLT